MTRLALFILFAIGTVAHGEAKSVTRDYDFKTTISQVVLENYLSRAVQHPGITDCSPEGGSPYFEDDLRMLRNTGAKFVGRAAYAWNLSRDDEAHFANVRKRAERIHVQDPDIILQACVFEIIGKGRGGADAGSTEPLGVTDIRVPAWVFEAFDLPEVKRNFDYEAMLFDGGKSRDFWGPDYSIPDISKLETRMWFFYRACRYIEAGCEAVHLGQLAMIGDADRASVHWVDVIERMRKFASRKARRGLVLFDAHVPASRLKSVVTGDGKLLLDYLSFPIRPRETTQPLEAVLVKGTLDSIYGKAPGGIHPQGWKCDMLPQLYEFDNCKTGVVAEGGILVWGADESTWFANQKPEYRDEFLKYTYEWIWNNSPHGYLQMPGRRPAKFPANTPRHDLYVINSASAACPVGQAQEPVVKAIWSDARYADVRVKRKPATSVTGIEPDPEPEHEASNFTRKDGRTLEQLLTLYAEFGVK